MKEASQTENPEKSPQAFGQRLQLARIGAGYESARQAAMRNGWAVRSYGFHEAGRSFPAHDTLAQYARAFRVSIDHLLTGSTPQDTASGVNQLSTSDGGSDRKSVPDTPFRRIPLLSDEQLRQLLIDKSRVMAAAPPTYVAPAPLGDDAFLYQIPAADISMVDNAGGPVSFPPQTFLTVDPGEEILPGQYVLAVLGGDIVMRRFEATRRYVAGEAFDLVPLNSAYRRVEIRKGSECHIFGRVVGLYMPV